MEEKKPLSIMVATPTMGDVPMQYAHSLVAMILKTKEKYPDCKITMAVVYRKMHHRARTELAETFLASDCTHLFFIDDDNIPSQDDLNKLIEHDLPIVSGLYFRREAPYEPIIMLARENGMGTVRRPDLYREGSKDLINIHSTGMGFMLIKREVVEAVKALGAPMFDVRGGVGEDIWFCIQAHGAGYDIFIDPTVEIGHLGERQMVTGKTYRTFYKEHVAELVEKASKIEGEITEAELNYLAETSANSNFSIGVGVGKGKGAVALSNSRRLVCVDNFGQNLDIFKENTKGLGRVEFLDGNIMELAENFPDEKADILFLGEDYEQALDEYWPKLGNRGRAILFQKNQDAKNVVDVFKENHGIFASVNPIKGTDLVEIIKL